jgi:YVTN family beta-propeller protein
VADGSSSTVSTIDVKTRTKNPTDITVGRLPFGVAITPDGRTAFVTNLGSDTVSTIDVKTRTKNPTDIPVGGEPAGIAITPDGKAAFVANSGNFGAAPFPLGNSVSTIDVKTRTKNPTDIPVGAGPAGVAITPDGRTAFVTNQGGTVSTIDVKTRTKHPDDIPVGMTPGDVKVTPDGKTRPGYLADMELRGKGIAGRVLRVNNEWVTITPKGFLAKAHTRGEKRIPIASITSVQFKKPGFYNGYIQFSLAGGIESTGGVEEAATDENWVFFRSRHTREFEEIRDFIEAKTAAASRLHEATAATVAGVPNELANLADLRDRGVLSEAEFEAAKARLLR